jgi:hypothetical protein
MKRLIIDESDLNLIIRAVYYAWCKAWGHNARFVMEATNEGKSNLKNKLFKGLCKDEGALDDLCLLKTFLGKLGGRVLADDVWREDVEEIMKNWKGVE